MESSVKQTSKYELSCSLCNQVFNLSNREPIRLICCGESACKECVINDMIKAEDKSVIKKGQFKCSFCEADHCQQPKVE